MIGWLDFLYKQAYEELPNISTLNLQFLFELYYVFHRYIQLWLLFKVVNSTHLLG